MTKSTSLGILVAIVASIGTTLIVVAATTDRDDPPKRPAIDALKPEQITKIPSGTTLPQGATAPTDYARFRILPEGAVPKKCPAPNRTDSARGAVEVVESVDPNALADHELRAIPSYVPSGWHITEVHGETTAWPDGAKTGTLFALQYERDGQFPVTVTRLAIDQSCLVELVSHPSDSNETYTLGTVAGRPAVIQHQAPGRGAQVSLEVHVRDGDVLTIVQGRAIDIDELIKTAASILEGTR